MENNSTKLIIVPGQRDDLRTFVDIAVNAFDGDPNYAIQLQGRGYTMTEFMRDTLQDDMDRHTAHTIKAVDVDITSGEDRTSGEDKTSVEGKTSGEIIGLCVIDFHNMDRPPFPQDTTTFPSPTTETQSSKGSTLPTSTSSSNPTEDKQEHEEEDNNAVPSEQKSQRKSESSLVPLVAEDKQEQEEDTNAGSSDEHSQLESEPTDPIDKLTATEVAFIKKWKRELRRHKVPSLSIGDLYVDPAHQRRGVGSTLVKMGFDVVSELEVDLDEYAPSPPPADKGYEDNKWGKYTFRYMVYGTLPEELSGVFAPKHN
ncbi:hypothetical protein QBC35DRAFT_478750 [Podospora australis]|uniref:N-acetyltransferase domain-containing protein n=1 Tax=Podospora australis TaxID=1536484 RepID=A0AAN6WIN5_9PEZI|nr:hypothetical protein QBC35DRAFT_478750 [Podospora australis]